MIKLYQKYNLALSTISSVKRLASRERRISKDILSLEKDVESHLSKIKLIQERISRLHEERLLIIEHIAPKITTSSKEVISIPASPEVDEHVMSSLKNIEAVLEMDDEEFWNSLGVIPEPMDLADMYCLETLSPVRSPLNVQTFMWNGYMGLQDLGNQEKPMNDCLKHTSKTQEPNGGMDTV